MILEKKPHPHIEFGVCSTLTIFLVRVALGLMAILVSILFVWAMKPCVGVWHMLHWQSGWAVGWLLSNLRALPCFPIHWLKILSSGWIGLGPFGWCRNCFISSVSTRLWKADSQLFSSLVGLKIQTRHDLPWCPTLVSLETICADSKNGTVLIQFPLAIQDKPMQKKLWCNLPPTSQ